MQLAALQLVPIFAMLHETPCPRLRFVRNHRLTLAWLDGNRALLRSLTRFRSLEHIRKMRKLLRIEDKVVTRSGKTFDGDDALMLLLAWLSQARKPIPQRRLTTI